MRNRVFRPIAAILSILILTGVPAQAGPVVISDVVQVLSSYQSSPSLRLRSISQNSAPVVSGVNTLVRVGTGRQSTRNGSEGLSDSLVVTDSSGSLFAGLQIGSGDQQRGGVQVITQGDVEGTVCDCGEILVPGGIPKWPLVFLAVIPFFFIHHDCENCDTPTPTPTPTPTATPTATPPPIPEPASLILFGTGLLAFGVGLRRRFSRGKLGAHLLSKEDG